jgi:acyl dehydratase
MTSLYYHDIQVGAVYRNSGRTATEADLTNFCMLSGDWNPIHVNKDYAEQTRFGERILPGLFGLSLITGAMTQWGIFEESAVAMLNVNSWNFLAPIMVGDTIYVEMEITGKRETSRKGMGLIERRFRVRDHTGKVLQEGDSDMMILMERPDGNK